MLSEKKHKNKKKTWREKIRKDRKKNSFQWLKEK